jgi:hypothetical protein
LSSKEGIIGFNMLQSQGAGIFIRFPKLLGEIRDLIWEHSLPGPRLTQLSFSKEKFAPQCGSFSPQIVLSTTCFESRKIVLLRYHRVIISKFIFLFDPSKDTLFLRLPMLSEDIRDNVIGDYPNP